MVDETDSLCYSTQVKSLSIVTFYHLDYSRILGDSIASYGEGIEDRCPLSERPG